MRKPLGALLLALVLLASLPLHAAHASLGGCRSDPVVVLDNGVNVNLDAAIANNASDITAIDYEIHIPYNRSVNYWIVVGDIPLSETTVHIYHDDALGRYDTAIAVASGASGYAITGTLSIQASGGTVLGSNQTVGTQGTWIRNMVQLSLSHAASGGSGIGQPTITSHSVSAPRPRSGLRPHLTNYISSASTPGSIYHSGTVQKLHQSWYNNGTPNITYYIRNKTTGNYGWYTIIPTPNSWQAVDIQWNTLTPGVTYVAWYCDDYNDCSNQYVWVQ